MKRLFSALYKYLIKKYPLFTGCATCLERPRPFEERRVAVKNQSFPIDLVYTWVNGGDPGWRQKREQFLPQKECRTSLSQGSALYVDSNELLYSLRSVESYLPWIRTIFIVTDGQTPSWLNRRHPKVRLVDHTDIIPSKFLPTFNSHVIEAYLHKIPDLGEHYIYCNDDFFFTSACYPEDFFTPNGLPHIFMDWRQSRRDGYTRCDTPHACSYSNTRNLMEERGIPYDQEIIAAHIAYPQTRRNADECFSFFRKTIEQFSVNKFRSSNELAFYCHALPIWSFYVKKAVPVDIPFYYINTIRFDRQTYYRSLLREKNSADIPLCICLNTVGEVPPDHFRYKEMTDFLESFYPTPASFEQYEPLARGRLML